MSQIQFDLIGSPLSGVNLIEASAGTGKTYTIAGLFLRLIVEQRIPLASILVVTFTDAATQELKERIRNRLKEGRNAFEKGTSEDPLMAALIENSENPEADRDIIDMAIRSFDQSSVFTIHGFCQRVLIENAFESGALFDTELVKNTDALFREVMADYYRINIYNQPDLFLSYLRSKSVSPDTFGAFVKDALRPGIRIIPDRSWMAAEKEEERFLDAYSELSESWRTERDAVIRILERDPGLNRSKYKASNISGWAVGMDRFLLSSQDFLNIPERLDKFTRSSINGAIKKGCQAPDHRLFDEAETFLAAHRTLSDIYKNNMYCLSTGALDYAEDQMGHRKDDQGIMGFDDLLVRLYQGVNGPRGERLCKQIRTSFRAALIDEFQDTDPIQYGIFSRVFAHDNAPLFMIGDPKQAIYSFRGADIFAYMKAAEEAEFRYSLGYNYRSAQGLIKAVNTLFELSEIPFVYDDIPFESAQPAKELTRICLNGPDGDAPDFRLWLLDAPEGTLSKGEARQQGALAVSREIVRLLDSGKKHETLLGDRPLCERDMAVLVRTNRDAQDMKQVLNQAGIPSVIYDTGNVFHTDMAGEMQRIVDALANPMDNGLVKAVLATECLGFSAEGIRTLDDRPGAMDEWTDRFREYHRLWLRFGFIEAVSTLINDQKVSARLMGLVGGERKTTNLFHLVQLLHQATIDGMGSPERLPFWMAVRMSEDTGAEEHQLRLESDDEAVRIVTVHKSKGMEYPVVFCPYAWDVRRQKNRDFCLFHDPLTRELVCDVGSGALENHCHLAGLEGLSEDLRLLYVALTRAKNRCYAIWGRIKDTGDSAMSYLLNRGQLPENEEDMHRITRNLESRSCGTIVCSRIEHSAVPIHSEGVKKQGDLHARAFRGKIDSHYKITSFSALTTRKAHPSDEADRDSISGKPSFRDEPFGQVEKTVFSFPKGAAAGTFLHDVFEHADFTEDHLVIEGLVREKLTEYGYDESWTTCIMDMVQNVIGIPLKAGRDTFTLSEIPNDRRLNELEFYYPLNLIESDALQDVFAGNGVPGFGSGNDFQGAAAHLNFSPVEGFLKGFVDLIFCRGEGVEERYYIVDWKSNFLGNRPEEYRPEVLAHVMAQEHYVLQYHLYVLALHRYLAMRLGENYRYSKYIGGVFYVFLRGVSPVDSRNGIFFDLPDESLINDLSHLFWGP